LFPFSTDQEDRPWLLLFAALAAAGTILLFAVSWFTAGGHFMLPLDDSYIHLQYARQLAQDSPLVYTEGMAPSGGMTSPFYVLLLTPMHFFGIEGAKGAFAAFLFGGALWMLAAIWTFQLVKKLASRAAGILAALLLMANGHIMWNFLSGMETGLFAVLLLGAALGTHCWLRDEQPHGRNMALACFAILPLVRPEGLVVLLAALAIVIWRKGQEPRLNSLPLLLCLLPFLSWLGILQLATGDWRPAGLTVKGLSSYPLLSLAEKFQLAAGTLDAIATRFYANMIPDPAYAAFKGTTTMPYIAPFLGFPALFGAGWVMANQWRKGRPAGGVLLALLWVLGLATLAASRLPFIHHQRYLAPYTVMAIALAAVGLWRIAQLFQQHEGTALGAVGAGFLLVSVPSLFFWTAEYGRNSRDIYHLLRRTTFLLQQSQQPAAISDAGVLAYYTDRPLYDLIGLGSCEFTRPAAIGEGAILEALSGLPQNRRPETLVSYPSWWSAEFPLGERQWGVSIPETSITSGTDLSSFPILWDQIDLGERPPIAPGVGLMFSLDVADLASEQAADYDFDIGIYDADHRAWPQPLAPVARFTRPATRALDTASSPTRMRFLVHEGLAVDGGRTVRGERFQFAPERFPTGVLVLHVRYSTPPVAEHLKPAAQGLAITIISNSTGYAVRRHLELAPVEPGGARTAHLDLTGDFDEAGGESWTIWAEPLPPGAAWSSYHYWITRRVAPSPEND